MNPTVADIDPKNLENAKRQFVEVYGSSLVLNTYLKIAVVLLSLVAIGLVGLNLKTAAQYANVKPLVIRIDDIGRAEAVAYDATRYQPQPPELRYFLTQFVIKHFSRIRATVQREFPDSLMFLESSLAEATIAQNDKDRAIEAFVTNPSADETDVSVQNVSFSELSTPAIQGVNQLSDGELFARNAAGAGPPDLRRASELHAPRQRSERLRPRQSARSSDCLFPD